MIPVDTSTITWPSFGKAIISLGIVAAARHCFSIADEGIGKVGVFSNMGQRNGQGSHVVIIGDEERDGRI
jgi:hypothetical protein